MHFDCYVWHEIEGIPIDWDSPLAWTAEIVERARSANVPGAERWTAYRLNADYSLALPRGTVEYRRAALVLYDGYEVVLVEHDSQDNTCGQARE